MPGRSPGRAAKLVRADFTGLSDADPQFPPVLGPEKDEFTFCSAKLCGSDTGGKLASHGHEVDEISGLVEPGGDGNGGGGHGLKGEW